MSTSLSSPNPSLAGTVDSRPATSAALEPQEVTQSGTPTSSQPITGLSAAAPAPQASPSSASASPNGAVGMSASAAPIQETVVRPPGALSGDPSGSTSALARGADATGVRGEARVPAAKRAAVKGAGKSKLRKDDGRLVRGRKSRARIREAALSLFRERGFDGATLRAIAERAGMGASSIYRHVQSKEELLIDELSEMQEEAWSRFRAGDDRSRPAAERLLDFFDVQHDLLVANRDLTTIALRATTKTEARVAKRVLQLYDRTIGLLMEILQHGRMKKHLARDVDVLETARVLFHVTNGARIPWANGMVTDDALRDSIHQAVYLLFRGVSAQPGLEASTGVTGAAGVVAENPAPRR